MFNRLSITACRDITTWDLLRYKSEGCSVYRTSHAGNWSLYKLLLSEIGLPDCIWDVTCMYRDVNNQPRYQLLGGEKLPLLAADPGEPDHNTRLLTPYQRHRFSADETLSYFHVRPLMELFGPTIITSQSELLLRCEEKLHLVFEIVAKYHPEWLGRYVFPCGCMVALERGLGDYRARCGHGRVAVVKQAALAGSGIATLHELTRLVFSPQGYEPKGGVLYSFELVVATFYLWSYWTFGDRIIYELSGPDMIGYATKPDFVLGVKRVLDLVSQHVPAGFMPEEFEAKIVPTTLFRFGYPNNCPVSKRVMAAHQTVIALQRIKREHELPEVREMVSDALRRAIEVIERDGKKWDLFHDPAKDAFWSQHDMLRSGARMEIPKSMLHVPFSTLGATFQNLAQTERSLARQLLPGAVLASPRVGPFGPSPEGTW